MRLGRGWHLAAVSRLPRLHRAGSLSLSRCERESPALRNTSIHTKVAIREQIEQEARAAGAAAPRLARRRRRRGARGGGGDPARAPCGSVLAANASRRRGGRRDGSTRARSTGCASTTGASTRSPARSRRLAALEPLEREIADADAANGLVVSERRIPIGTVGANFEARPNVALDVAAQLLKSLNAARAAHRRRRAADRDRRSSTRCCGPRSSGPGCPRGAVGLVRSADHEGARALVSLPDARPARDPPRERRDDGRARAARRRAAASARSRTRRAAASSTSTRRRSRRWRSRSPRRASTGSASATGSTSPRRPRRAGLLSRPARRCFAAHGLEVRGRRADGARAARPAARARVGERPGARRDGHASRSSTASTRRCGSPNEETSGLAAAIVTEDARAAAALPRRLSRHGRVLARADAIHRRLRADRGARDGDQRRLDARAARAGHLPRPLAAPVPRHRRRDADAVTVVVKLGIEPRRRAEGARSDAVLLADRGREIAPGRPAAIRCASSRQERSRSACPGSASTGGRGACRSCRRPPRSARRGSRRPGMTRSRRVPAARCC